ncbi:hypothetical protein PORCRE_1888 [Porphyromonas crevioricanis JCM 15906]|uniref:Uncharacterized protein n=1 Tax=Porphyromonas crevioricanis JCM 15906 TaxID=1305617 RepID=T1CIY1_9PORP|nr:hypothetical protein PORCRE_1888 [Porphyromonas crevioricanis JCM 15906]GAD08565.1 hypothetical protein PORCAN_2213 [Porphyromonas crevioricanis JCM 13913]
MFDVTRTPAILRGYSVCAFAMVGMTNIITKSVAIATDIFFSV